MTQKPLLTIKSKDFLSGLAYGAHVGTGGIFFKADGVTPLIEAGALQSVNNGLLMAGSSGTQISGNLGSHVPISSAQYTNSSNTTFYFGTHDGHIFSLVADTTFATSLSDLHTATSLRQGMDVFTQVAGTNMLFYFMDTAIGRYDFATFNDSWATISSDGIHCSHRYFDQLLFGNATYVGRIFDNAGDMSTSGAGNLDKTKLAIGSKGIVTDISDDGIYAIIATTKNITCDSNATSGCSILFWDGFSTTWSREYQIPDPFIFSLEHTPTGVYAYGVTGIWQVSFGADPRKIFGHSPSIYSVNASGALLYGRPATSHYADALLWGGASGSNKAIKSLGKLDGNAPSSYLHPFLSTASKNITLVDGNLLKGYVFVGDDTPLLKAYPFNVTSPATGVSAQTVYFELDGPYDITKIRITFGEPLASGDSLTVAATSDEDTAATTFGTIAYDSAKTVRSKTLFAKMSAEDGLSITLTFNAGSVKIKKIEVFADERELANK